MMRTCPAQVLVCLLPRYGLRTVARIKSKANLQNCTLVLCHSASSSAHRTMTGHQTAVTLEEPTGDLTVHVVKDFPIPAPGKGEVSAQLATRGIWFVLLFW